METKINIAASQAEDGTFNLVITKRTTDEDGNETAENLIRSSITLEDLKAHINAL